MSYLENYKEVTSHIWKQDTKSLRGEYSDRTQLQGWEFRFCEKKLM